MLTGPYLEQVDVAADTPVRGMNQDSGFIRWIRDNDRSIPFQTIRREVVETASSFVDDRPNTGALVLECSNLAPFTADISDALGLPVYDCVSLVNWFHAGLRPRRYNPR